MTSMPDITERRRVAAAPGPRGGRERAASILHRAIGLRTRRTALRSLLWASAQALVVAARLSSSVRLQITRSFTFEISTDDGVARQWVFDNHRRRVRTSAGSPNTADHTLRFTSSREALRVLVSTDAADRMADGLYRETARIEGHALIPVWFLSLMRTFIPIGRATQYHRALPRAYLRHDPAANGNETIVIEPAVSQLDPRWTDAWTGRAKLWIIRGANGELLKDP
jgi:hypothetical protein